MIKAALIGAGARGMFSYASYALKNPREIQFVRLPKEFQKGVRNLRKSQYPGRNAIYQLGTIAGTAETV